MPLPQPKIKKKSAGKKIIGVPKKNTDDLTGKRKPMAAHKVQGRPNAVSPTPNRPVASVNNGKKPLVTPHRPVPPRKVGNVNGPVTKRPISTGKHVQKRPSSHSPVSRKAAMQQARSEQRRVINNKIQAHTPARRQEVRQIKRVSGSAKNIEIKRRNEGTRQRFQIKRKKINYSKQMRSRLTLFFLLFIIIFATFFGIFRLSLSAGGLEKGSDYTLQLGEDLPEDKKEAAAIPEEYHPIFIELDGKNATKDSVVYIPMSALSEMCEFTVTGTPEDIRYIPRESEGQSIGFKVNSDMAYINGVAVKLSSPTFVSDGKLYVPVDILENYAKGLTVEIDSNERDITVYRNIVDIRVKTGERTYDKISFGLSEISPIEKVPEPEEEEEKETED